MAKVTDPGAVARLGSNRRSMNGAGATNLFSFFALKRDDPLTTVPGTCRWIIIERGDGKNDVRCP